MGSGNVILIAAASGRALAASARRGGIVPLVADFFADADTAALAAACVRLPDGLTHGMDGEALLEALDRLAAGYQPAGVICGTGFEDRPHLLARLAERWRLYGNGAETVARVKDPTAFASLCRVCDVACPQTAPACPAEPAGWLAKRRGGAGGGHIREPANLPRGRTDVYFQRRVPGVPVSALFAADGRRAAVLGFSAQWPAPTRGRPFRYGGAVRPVDITPAAHGALSDALRRLVPATGLVGLNSADFLVDGDDVWLLEINPRPGATLDLFEPPDTSLVALHVAACEGKLTERPAPPGAAASAIVYADCDISSFPVVGWPGWAADRPHPGAALKAGDPMCTVRASASDASEARRLVEQRAAAMLARVRVRAA